MPIRRDEFEKGKSDPSYLLLEFLKSNEDLAFSLAELMQIEGFSNSGIEELQRIPHLLASEDKVDRKEISGVLYYIFKKRQLGFRSS